MRLVAGVFALLFGVGLPNPAHAHGALTTPVSRSAACGDIGSPDAPACRAAGGQVDWSNLRLPGVNGRDRRVVPDGELCSAGKREFAGLDLVRADWPVTRLTAGATMTFRYGQTIPHRGTFRLYLTKAGFDPSRPLRWADLPERPFLTVTDPPLRDEAYTFTGTLPNRSGRHIIYTIWQNSSTPDTYYSCSDVVVAQVAAEAPAARAPAADAPGASAPAAAPSPSDAPLPASPAGTASTADDISGVNRAAQRRGGSPVAASLLVVAALAGVGVLGAAVAVRLRRRSRRH